MANGLHLHLQQRQTFVSVPLRGKYRGELEKACSLKIPCRLVSVPLRGKYRGESVIDFELPDPTHGRFRPLAG